MDNAIKRIGELEANSLGLKVQLLSIDKNTESLIAKSDNAVRVATEVSTKLSDIIDRLGELSRKIDDTSKELVEIKISQARREIVLSILENNLDELKNNFTKQIQNCQYKFDDNSTALVTLKNEQNIFIQRTDRSIGGLTENDDVISKNIANIREVLNDMERVKHGWMAIKYVAAIFAAALGVMVAAREVYESYIK